MSISNISNLDPDLDLDQNAQTRLLFNNAIFL